MVSYNWVERYNKVDFLVRFYRWLGKNIMPWYKNGMKRLSISNRFNRLASAVIDIIFDRGKRNGKRRKEEQ